MAYDVLVLSTVCRSDRQHPSLMLISDMVHTEPKRMFVGIDHLTQENSQGARDDLTALHRIASPFASLIASTTVPLYGYLHQVLSHHFSVVF